MLFYVDEDEVDRLFRFFHLVIFINNEYDLSFYCLLHVTLIVSDLFNIIHFVSHFDCLWVLNVGNSFTLRLSVINRFLFFSFGNHFGKICYHKSTLLLHLNWLGHSL